MELTHEGLECSFCATPDGTVDGATLEVALTLRNLFDARHEHPAADSNWQNALEQDGRAVRLRLDYRF